MKQHTGIMFVAAVALAVIIMVVSAALPSQTADAGSDPLEYAFLVSPGRALVSADCDQTDAATAFDNCPDRALADNGDAIDIVGSGALSLHDKSASGGGEFIHHFAGGGAMSGTWEATELLSYKTYGPSPILNPTWRTGMARIRIRMVSSDGSIEADGILTLGCILPEVKLPPGGVIEGVRVNVQGLINFNEQVDPRATLFILTSGDDGF